MSERPHGFVTFLFTDIEGSTHAWEHYPDAMWQAFAQHERIIRTLCLRHGGFIYKMIGDAFQIAFALPLQAILTAVDIQRSLITAAWGDTGPLRVRMAIHSARTEERPDDYVGPALNRLARILASGHGDQILVSSDCEQAVREALPPWIAMQNIGEYHLRDLRHPECIFQIVVDDLPRMFPPLKSTSLARDAHRRREDAGLPSRPKGAHSRRSSGAAPPVVETAERGVPTRARSPRPVEQIPQEWQWTSLPLTPTPLIGRAGESAALWQMLEQDAIRLITLTGPGGVGKTRLAIHIAAEFSKHAGYPAIFIPLAAVSSPSLLAATLLHALNLRFHYALSDVDQLITYLTDQSVLLVLDNFEHVVEASPLIVAILAAAPRVKLLITSRSVLSISGEHEYAVPPLPVPVLPRNQKAFAPEDMFQVDSVRLFLARVHAVKPEFRLDHANALDVATLCQRLDGLPLAIELVAAWIKILTPQEILVRLSNPFALLTTGSSDLPARHQTLRNTLDWSYALLKAEDRALFVQLSVFRAGWSIQAAEYILKPSGTADATDSGIDVLHGLLRLVNQSLIYRYDPAADTPRFAMFTTIRDYAQQHFLASPEHDRVYNRYVDYYIALVEEAEPYLTREPALQKRWLQRLENEHDNIRAAMQWAFEHQRDKARRLGASVWRFWYLHGDIVEGREWLQGLLTTDSAAGSPYATQLRHGLNIFELL